MEVQYILAKNSNALDVRYKKIIFSAKTATEVWNVAIPVVSDLSTLEPGHTGERRGRQELAEERQFEQDFLRCLPGHDPIEIFAEAGIRVSAAGRSAAGGLLCLSTDFYADSATYLTDRIYTVVRRQFDHALKRLTMSY